VLLRKTVLADDGLPLEVFSTPLDGAITAVYINAFGVSSSIVRHLAERAYSRGINLLTWQTRGTPGVYREDFRSYDSARHCGDLFAILDAYSLPRVALIGWCGSCQIALHAARERPTRIMSAALMAGYYGFDERLSTVAGRMMIEMAVAIAADESKAALFHDLLARDGSDAAMPPNDDFSPKALSETFKRSRSSLLRWALMESKLVGSNVTRWAGDVKAPTLVLAGALDQMMGVADAIRISEHLAKSVTRVFEDADHYALFLHAAVQDAVLTHIERWATDNEAVKERHLQ